MQIVEIQASRAADPERHQSCLRGACSALQMPLADSVVLTIVFRLRGTILAPDESSNSWTLLATPLVSKPFKAMTFSLSFTDEQVSNLCGDIYIERDTQ